MTTKQKTVASTNPSLHVIQLIERLLVISVLRCDPNILREVGSTRSLLACLVACCDEHSRGDLRRWENQRLFTH